ncbi:MAG TPA: hypothetical protein VL126_02375 [Bacteroidota bacterium]|nr:hypothetical protein [Bacteroidota bacterium]
MRVPLLCLLLLLSLMMPLRSGAQRLLSSVDTSAVLRSGAPKIFIDCASCDQDYIRTEIAFVNYVRDPNTSDVHVLMTTQPTASGGTEYTLTLIGHGPFDQVNDTLVYIAKQSETDDITRAGIVRVLKAGLLRYAMHSPLAEYLSVNYDQPAAAKEVVDPWDFWVFRTTINDILNWQQQQKSTFVYGSFSANKITPDWKFSVASSLNYSEYSYQVDSVTTVVSIQRSFYVNGLAVKSLTDHWSAGLFASFLNSIYTNTDYAVFAAPAIEYDLFSYSESTRQQLRFTYKFGVTTTRYIEETIFDKTKEPYLSQDLAVALELKQPWGTVSTTLEGTQYPWDFRNQGRSLREQITWSLTGLVSWRIIEGLSLNTTGTYQEIHNQFGLVKRGLSPEDILLQRSQLATNRSYFVSIGFSYTFGSIFNNVVNPRMGSTGGGGITISIN